MKSELTAVLYTLSAKPGVYLFKDAAGKALYVGKAANLRSRTRSYFQAHSNDTRMFIPFLEREVHDIETIVVRTEKEAALLENTLIKQYQPKYNVKLRDDKEYLSLRLNPNATWPRLETVRRPQQDGAMYFGPYHSATSARRTLRLVNRHFKLRTCTDTEFRSRKRPCLQYQIKRCPAPCVYDVDRTHYLEQVRNVGMFLNGKHDELSKLLISQMKQASKDTHYELAAMYRDQANAVDVAQQAQHVAVATHTDQDVVHFFKEKDCTEFAVLLIREGKLTAVRSFTVKKTALPDTELLSSFLTDYYDSTSYIPKEILLPHSIELMGGFSEMLSERRGSAVKLLAPKRGPRRQLLNLAFENAEQNFMERKRLEESHLQNLEKLQHLLHLSSLPRRIECIDISHTGGDDTVAAIVVSTDGVLDKAAYRSFHIRTAKRSDDYGAMLEVLSRRFKRGKNLEEGWDLPNLLVVDGGRGQIKVAQTALAELDLSEIAVIGIAKERQDVHGETLLDRIYVPGRKNPIALRGHSETLVITQLRDEAHRFSNHLREQRNTKRILRSDLDDIRGVGTHTRKVLLERLGSMAAVRTASIQELTEAGLGQKQAEYVHAALRSDASDSSKPPEPLEEASQTEHHPSTDS